MINELAQNYEEKRADRTSLSPEEHMAVDVSGVAQRCIREGIIPTELQITEADIPRVVLVRRVELELVALLRASRPTPRITAAKRLSRELFISGPESRRLGRSVADDVKGLIQRCINENVAPSDLHLTETGKPRDFLIRRVNERIIALLQKTTTTTQPE